MHHKYTISILKIYPLAAFESLAFGGILLITIYSVVINKNYQQAIPMIGLYALAAYRIMPALQQIFQSVSSIRYGQSALNASTTSSLNVAIGYYAMQANTTGAENVAVGIYALDANTTGENVNAVKQDLFDTMD